jgi:hypothetical protein
MHAEARIGGMLHPVGQLDRCRYGADIVAKRFCPSDCARLIQVEAPMRNIDSNTLLRRFDCCRFLFHRALAATFATISASAWQRNKYRL